MWIRSLHTLRDRVHKIITDCCLLGVSYGDQGFKVSLKCTVQTAVMPEGSNICQAVIFQTLSPWWSGESARQSFVEAK